MKWLSGARGSYELYITALTHKPSLRCLTLLATLVVFWFLGAQYFPIVPAIIVIIVNTRKPLFLRCSPDGFLFQLLTGGTEKEERP